MNSWRFPQGRLHQQMEVIAHQDVGEDLGLVDLGGASQQIEEGVAVGIGGEDILAGIASTGDMIIGILELDPKGPGHDSDCMNLYLFVKDKDLTPFFPGREKGTVPFFPPQIKIRPQFLPQDLPPPSPCSLRPGADRRGPFR